MCMREARGEEGRGGKEEEEAEEEEGGKRGRWGGGGRPIGRRLIGDPERWQCFK